ncbi:hypothetical protein [Nocardia macrotermitis]|uniref:Uncharacterized protein n=1 Tax=Nocardia macrotermitis TaxID=2585198 RepID=A0A7K0CZ82_9NOCA|nr:hypothetical protein [Nocardia macrotermitis]MQY17974.1 hypothetical protein [Nocardia macrotermitis]
MPDLSTREHTREYLAEIFPSDDREWRIHQFPHGWICQPEPTPEQLAAGQALGRTNLLIDAHTAVVLEYPSWSIDMVADDYTTTKQNGLPPNGRQIHPPLWRLSIHRLHETPDTITYHVELLSLATPPAEPAEYDLTIDKRTFQRTGNGPLSGIVIAWTESRNRQHGAWPARGTWNV